MAKKAFLVGINDYAPRGHGGPDLRGCVNDVRDMAHTLNVLGIVPARPACMQIRTNARATRANILNGLLLEQRKETHLFFIIQVMALMLRIQAVMRLTTRMKQYAHMIMRPQV